MPSASPVRRDNDPTSATELNGSLTPARRRGEGRSHFDIYRTERVQLTSTLFGGGDWQWRLTVENGPVLAQGGGYRTQRDCFAAVEALRAEAWSATVCMGPELYEVVPDNIRYIAPGRQE